VRTKFDLLLRKRPPNIHGVWICPIREKYFNPSSTKAVVWNYRAVEDLYSFSGCDSKHVSCRNSRWERESSYCGQPARTMVRSVWSSHRGQVQRYCLLLSSCRRNRQRLERTFLRPQCMLHSPETRSRPRLRKFTPRPPRSACVGGF
jgi:hypothetical protein